MCKKIAALFLVSIMIISLTACGQGGITSKDLMKSLTTDTKDDKNTEGDTSTEVISCDGDRLIIDSAAPEEANAAVSDFSVRLFQNALEMEMRPGQETPNVLVSPISVFMALSMTANGAEGETLSQMEQVLGLTTADLNAFALDYLANLPSEEKYNLNMANSIWFTNDERFTVKEEFLQTNKDYYGADVYKAAFDDSTVKDINTWVEDNTDGLIKNILNEIPSNAVMYLVNALVFEAEWEDTYDESQVREGIFTLDIGLEQEVDMMYSEETLYLEDENATGFLKYYAGQKYAFAALLPNENISVYNYVKTLSGEHLQNMLTHPVEVHVDAWMPQFDTEYSVEMKSVLANMGMTDVFDGGKADLTGLGISTGGNIWVERVLHKTYIEVGPQGTKAGAATAVEAVDECAPVYEDSREVKLDRPFIYMIIDCENNQPIFMGAVNYVKPYQCGTDGLCGYPLAE